EAGGEAPADRILPRKELLRHRLADDGDERTVFRVLAREFAAADQRDAERPEESRPDDVRQRRPARRRREPVALALAPFAGVATLDGDRGHAGAAGQHGNPRDARRAYAWDLLHALGRAPVELASLRLRVAQDVDAQGRRDDLVHRVAGIDRLHGAQAA